TGRPDRGAWTQPRPALPAAEIVPFTQLGGWLNPRGWREGRPSGPRRRTPEGHPHLRRGTGARGGVRAAQSETRGRGDEGDALPHQQPAHDVCVQPFLIDAEPVSVTAFARFLNSVGRIPAATVGEWCLTASNDRRRPYFPLEQRWHGWKPQPGTER